MTNLGKWLTVLTLALVPALVSCRKSPISNMVGTLNLRSHMAQVDIRYTTTSYSITYRDSKDLNYDGSNIHRNYNNWIRNLDQAIKQQLASL